ncbi:MAG: substrate-binding domain-containing protein [Candidatus Nanopelagicales bacterium]|nr:substrate-binding domain-containing protein [Candidatus Nanopelagicales bacterium]MCH1463309.1 substrate-binding domain-containing protein [Candidatus Nanopelagicales bacterium]
MLDPRRGRGIALSAFALSVAVMASACTPPMPPDVLAAQAESQIECQTGSTDVSVPENLLGAMTFVGDALTSVCPEQTLMEIGPQEPAKLKVVDGTPSPQDVSEFSAVCPAGDVIYVPLFSYPVTLAYNIFGLEGLVLTAEVVAGILNGSITAWEDPAITDANEGFDLSGLPDIEVYTVDQDRGSVQAMTTWLSEEAPQSWSEGTLERLPGNINFGSSFEMTEELAFMEGAVAVLPVFEAFNAFVPTAAFPVTYGDDGAQEELIAFPDDPQLAKIGSGAMALSVDDQGNIAATPAVGGIPDDEIFDLAASKIILQEDQPVIGWPVLGTGHLLVCDDPADPLPLSVAQYSLRLAGQGALETYGLTPLPEPVRIKTFEPLKVTVAGEN